MSLDEMVEALAGCFRKALTDQQTDTPRLGRSPENGEKVSRNWNSTQWDLLGLKFLDSSRFSSEHVGRKSCNGCPLPNEGGSDVCSYCSDCEELYCKRCSEIHRNFSFAASHRLSDVKYERPRDLNYERPRDLEYERPRDVLCETSRFCEVHTDEEESFYCVECGVPMCEVCCIEQHVDCKYVVPVDNAVLREDMIVGLEQYLDTIEEQIRHVNEFLVGLQWETEKLSMETESAKQSLDLREKLATGTVSHFTQVLLKDLEHHSTERLSTFESEFEDSRRDLEELEVFTAATKNCVEIASPADVVQIGSTVEVRRHPDVKSDLQNWSIDPITFDPSTEIEKIFADENIRDIFGTPHELEIDFDKSSFVEYKESLNNRRRRIRRSNSFKETEKNTTDQQERITREEIHETVNKTQNMENFETIDEFYDTNPKSSASNLGKMNRSMTKNSISIECYEELAPMSDHFTMESPDRNTGFSSMQSATDSGFFSLDLTPRHLTFSPAIQDIDPDINSDSVNEDIDGCSKASHVKTIELTSDGNEIIIESKQDPSNIDRSFTSESYHSLNADSSNEEACRNSDSLSFHSAKTSDSRNSLNQHTTAETSVILSEIRSESVGDNHTENGEGRRSTNHGNVDELFTTVDKNVDIKDRRKTRRKNKTKQTAKAITRSKTTERHKSFSDETEWHLLSNENLDFSHQDSSNSGKTRRQDIRSPENHSTRPQSEEIDNRNQSTGALEASVRNITAKMATEEDTNRPFFLPSSSEFDVIDQQPRCSQSLDPNPTYVHRVFPKAKGELPARKVSGLGVGFPPIIQSSASPCVQPEHGKDGNSVWADWKYPNGNPYFVSDVLESTQHDFTSTYPVRQYPASTHDLRKEVPKPLPSEFQHDSKRNAVFCCEGDVFVGSERFGKGTVKVVIPADGLPTVQLEWEEELVTITMETGFERIDQSKVVVQKSKGIIESHTSMLDFETKEDADQFENDIYHLIQGVNELEIR